MSFKILTFISLVSAFVCIAFYATPAQSQVAAAARRGPSLTAGAFVSAFDPNYLSNNLEGFGGYVDLNVIHGLGIEAEGRWQHFHEFEGVSQDNYLVGPRLQLHSLWIAHPYVKVLGGFSEMNFEENLGNGRFTTIAAGGGVDFHLTRRLTFRAIDFEYQVWPSFLDTNLKPFGASVGVGYRIF